MLDVGSTWIEDTFRIKLVHLLTLYKSALEPEALVRQVLSAPVANLSLSLGLKTPVLFLPKAHDFLAARIFSGTVNVQAGTAELVASLYLLVGHLSSGLHHREMLVLLRASRLLIHLLFFTSSAVVGDGARLMSLPLGARYLYIGPVVRLWKHADHILPTKLWFKTHELYLRLRLADRA